ncbi:MAG: phosphoribosylanthranilate isomerase [Rhodospirillaceae bacterium]|nr:phosphoribosylanthranilate isomerase [Rhodospirillaceae bacterium]MBE90048.1 phosphoribosylanthranilate isomerase [Rhodospirillaceae bacterium]|tara:strand:+ start:819 stop:1466 length:648 start_codon:yes stop_codon:yes gene_type:complete
MTTTAKICGINDPNTMSAAIDGGASHVGLVFYKKSPRAVTVEQANELSNQAQGRAVRVGLFVDPTDATLETILNTVSLDLLQLHGTETPRRTTEIKTRFGLHVMKVLSVAEREDVEKANTYLDAADWLMFDAQPPKSLKNALPGGNAVSFDWSLLSGKSWPKPWMLAGGLTANNVSEAIRLTGASVVDTSSGVEDRPGLKNPAKTRAFLKMVAKA